VVLAPPAPIGGPPRSILKPETQRAERDAAAPPPAAALRPVRPAQLEAPGHTQGLFLENTTSVLRGSAPRPVTEASEPPTLARRSEVRFQEPPAAGQELPAAVPPGAPFEMIHESGTLSVQVRRSLLLRTQKDVYRTATVDESICEIVQFTPRELSIIGRSTGSTHVTFWFDDPDARPVTYVVEVKPDAAEVKKEEDKFRLLEDVLNEMFPDSKIKLTLVADKVIVRGQAKDSEEAFQIMTILRAQAGYRGGIPGGTPWNAGISEGQAAQVLSDTATGAARRTNYQIVNMLRVPGVQQVALRVKIAELNRSAARNFGLDIQGTIDLNDSSKILLNSLSATTNGQAPPILFNIDGDDITIGLNALQEHGVVKLLSEPTLVTMSGRPATFIAGGEFAVPTAVGFAGPGAITTDFRAFGAIISFLPTVVDKDRIRLEVAPEFSQINSDLTSTVNNIPGLNVRAATTTVEMREGQTLAIAGLLEDSMTANTAGDLPLLQRLIGRRGVTRNETELIILVTPELVHPMEPEEVPPLPGFDVTEPTNCQFYLHGDIEGNPTMDYRSTVWPRLRQRYKSGGPAMTSGPFGHGQ
jgi:pilus assembly protein CpaC